MADMIGENLTLKVMQDLKAQIFNFKLLPGVRISDKEVAQKMGMSRSPVREALVRLSEQGLVKSRHNRGFTVRDFSVQEVEDLYTLREAIEVLAVRLALQRLDKKKTQSLQQHLDRYPFLMESSGLMKFNEVDEEFHDLIATYSGNELLTQNWKSLHGQIRIVRRYDYLRPNSFRETYADHSQIFEHMRHGETSKAQKCMSRHIIKSMRIIIKMLKDCGY
ncbi:MAG: GntR family transcriptional regulator [Desulfobacterales bacterium]|nr:MAG: GntR family transcriptional regulator [Desulfobacterales bacterium]